jgi:quercetin dioxygenase-like cupin family protein
MTQQDLIGNPHNLTNLLDYQDGAIVSKTLLKHKSGSVTLFAFDEGEELSDHTVAFNALVHILDGEAEIGIEGEPHTVRAGEMIIFPADKPHALKATTKFKMLLVMIWGTKR